MNLPKTLLLIVTSLWTINSLALDENKFYQEHSYNKSTTISASSDFTNNNSSELQNAINQMSNAGGGDVIIPAGKYYFYKVTLKSNVNIIIDKDAIIRPHTPSASGNYEIFRIGMKTAVVKNISITSSGNDADSTQRFTIDLEHLEGKNRVFVFSLGNVDNFLLSGFNIKDTRSWGQSVNLTLSSDESRGYPVPHNGIVKDAFAQNTQYGYGLVQIQAGKNILFKNLSGTGGVTLRLETGWEYMNRVMAGKQTLDQVYGRNIRCYYGQAAVMTSTHTMDQGTFDIRDVYASNCEFAVRLDKGHKEGKYGDRPDLSPGTFAEGCVLAHVKAVYGTKATVRNQHLRYVPCNVQHHIKKSSDNNYISPSCAPVGNFAGGNNAGHSPTDDGSYHVKIWDVQSVGFDKSVPNVSLGDYYDYEGCAYTSNGYWVPKECKNTAAQRHWLTNIDAPTTAGKGKNHKVSISYDISASADLHFELMDKQTGEIVVSKKRIINKGKGSASENLLIPNDIEEGDYLWKGWISYPDKGIETYQLYKDVTIDNTSSIDQNQFDLVKVFPNPFSNTLSIEMPSNHSYEKLSISNILGATLHSQDIDKTQSLISVELTPSSLEKGMYIVQLKDKSCTKTYKVLKN